MANFNTNLRRIVKQADRSLNPSDGTMVIDSVDFYWLAHNVRIGNKDNLLELNEMYVQENKSLKRKLSVLEMKKTATL